MMIFFDAVLDRLTMSDINLEEINVIQDKIISGMEFDDRETTIARELGLI